MLYFPAKFQVKKRMFHFVEGASCRFRRSAVEPGGREFVTAALQEQFQTVRSEKSNPS